MNDAIESYLTDRIGAVSDRLIPVLRGQDVYRCRASPDGIHYWVAHLDAGTGRLRGVTGAVTRAMAVGAVGEALVARADQLAGVTVEEVG